MVTDPRKILAGPGSVIVSSVLTLLLTADPIIAVSLGVPPIRQSSSEIILGTPPSEVPAMASGEKRAKHSELNLSEAFAVVDRTAAKARRISLRLVVQHLSLVMFSPIQLILSSALFTSSSL